MRASLLLVPVFLSSALSAQDNLDGPWATVNGDNAGTQSTTAIPYQMGTGPAELAWRLNVRAAGHDRVAGRNPITFDADGNLYWKSSIGGGTAGLSRVVSASSDGSIRWFGNESGVLHDLGDFFDSTAVVVGESAVYAIGSLGDPGARVLTVAAYEKETGELIWQVELDGAIPAVQNQAANLLTPVLHEGKLYVIGPDLMTLLPQNVHQVDVATGDADWSTQIPEIQIAVNGQATFVPDVFDVGEHGLYFHGDSGGANDGVPDVYGIKLTDSGAELVWSDEGGKVARSHLIYSEVTETLYAHTWTDYGGELYTFDPETGLVAVNQNQNDTGHGFYDVGCLDFNGTDVIAGGFNGLVIRYQDDGTGITRDTVAFDDESLSGAFFGEYRVYGQLLQSPEGNSILITGTNSDTDSDPSFSARVVAIDVTAGSLLWEFDTGIVQNHGFTVRGGPTMGPDGKLYYFDAVTGELVALKGPTVVERSRFIRGDPDCDGLLNLTDAIYIFGYLFLGGPAPCCEDISDANNDGNTDLSDGVFILSYLFVGGADISAPFPDCGEDPEGAECEAHTVCNPEPQ